MSNIRNWETTTARFRAKDDDDDIEEKEEEGRRWGRSLTTTKTSIRKRKIIRKQ